MKKNEIAKRIEFRQSTIKDYLACPLMLRFKHLEKLEQNWRNSAALHGSTLHKLIEMIHTVNCNLQENDLYREIFEYFELHKEGENHIPVFWKTEREKELSAYEKNAIEILDGYRKFYANRTCTVLYSEVQFRIRIAGYTFTGTIDQVRKNADGTVELLDFKSNKQMPTMPFRYNDWQLNLYLYAVQYGELLVGNEWIRPGLNPDYASWYFLRGHEIRKRTTVNGKAGEQKGNPLIRTQKGKEDLKLFRNQIGNLLKVMLKDWHFPNPNHCNLCGYTSTCVNRASEIPLNLADEARKLIAETEAA